MFTIGTAFSTSGDKYGSKTMTTTAKVPQVRCVTRLLARILHLARIPHSQCLRCVSVALTALTFCRASYGSPVVYDGRCECAGGGIAMVRWHPFGPSAVQDHQQPDTRSTDRVWVCQQSVEQQYPEGGEEEKEVSMQECNDMRLARGRKGRDAGRKTSKHPFK